MLPAPKDSILPGFEAIFAAFEDVIQVELVRARWEEIKRHSVDIRFDITQG